MFFDADEYLEKGPSSAADGVEAERLVREARQRAKFCETIAQIAAKDGFAAATANRVFRSARLGSSTFYKLYETPEACLLEAFEKCAWGLLAEIESAMAAQEGPTEKIEAGLRELLAALAEEPAVTALVLIEVRAGGEPCRKAQQRWLMRFAELLQGANDHDEEIAPASTTRMAVDAVASVLVTAAREAGASALPAVLPDVFYVTLVPFLGPVAARERTKRSFDEFR